MGASGVHSGRSYVSTATMKGFAMFKRSPLNDGTQGYRYSWGLTRKRVAKKRYGITFGPTMVGTHYGKRSVYIERKSPANLLWNFAG